MYDLNGEIRKWREAFLCREAFRPADLDEMEGHLRELVRSLVSLGLSEEEAFGVACHRFGSPEMLEPEFAKANGGTLWGRRIGWMVAGYLVITLLGSIGAILADSSVAIGALQGMRGWTLAILGGWVFFAFLAASVLLAAALTSGRLERFRGFLDRSLDRANSIRGAARMIGIFFLLWLSALILGKAMEVITVRCMIPSDFGRLVLWKIYLGFTLTVLGFLALFGLLLWIRGGRKRKVAIVG